ncbi:unnamed protein product [Caenorhabditis auriculariae]|uniref:Uncharacterized protein n=1 Tax=Caenorhabditis auriculariae TaxID=2777116 RepID=A0A8S1HQ35_9PELO|nr:unnamed protein product [Caenorhabditis auriculariae]
MMRIRENDKINVTFSAEKPSLCVKELRRLAGMVVSFSKARLKRQLVVMFHIILWTLPTTFAIDKCCTRAMFSYPSGDAIPPECSVDTIKCTESVITMENPASTSTAVRSFLSRATKTGAIIVHGNADPPLIISNLKEISHEGPGPALFLKNPKLVAGNCFNQLQKISVKDISTYCEKRDLLRLEGVTAEVRNILETVANQTLLECEKLTTTAVVDTTTTTIISSSVTSNNTLGLPHACVHNVSSAASASASAQNKDEEKECPSYTGLLYAGTIAIALLLITSAVAITVATRLYFFRKDEDAALAVYISHVTQLMNMMIFLQSGKDNSMLHGYMLDGLHKKSAPLKAITDKYHAQANVRKHKFQKNQPLDPKNGSPLEGNITLDPRIPAFG